MKHRNIYTAAVILAILFTFATACKHGPSPNGTVNLKVSMANTITAARAIQQVNVDIQKISINTSADTGATSGWFDLATHLGVYNLLDYTAGKDTILAFDSVLVAQTVNQVRLLLGVENSVMDDSVSHPLNTPSGQTSGIKIAIHAPMEPGNRYIIELDFDPYQSVVKTGDSTYNLKPVIKATLVQQ